MSKPAKQQKETTKQEQELATLLQLFFM